ncbi:MAG: hypothetical protein RL190_1104 [Actinomycetota bacterium]|jgi:hypothetical protein
MSSSRDPLERPAPVGKVKAPAPIVVRCPCGTETRARAGEVVRCRGCGARYDTEEQARMLNSAAALTQRRFKLLGRVGVGVVGLLGLLALSQFGPYAMLGVALAAGVLWYGIVMRWLKRRTIDRAVERFTATVEQKRR